MAKRNRSELSHLGATTSVSSSKVDKTKNKSNKRKNKNEGPSSSGKDPGQDHGDVSTWSKSKKKRMRLLKAKMKRQTGDKDGALVDPKRVTKEILPGNTTTAVSSSYDNNKKTKPSLQDAFKARLTGSRFRILNEELYTTTSSESYDRFSKEPELFQQYHEGFRHQVEQWPVNPVDAIVRWLSNYYQKRSDKSSTCVVADFGCGDAQLAKDLLKIEDKNRTSGGQCPFTIHSFDLVSQDPLVTACDMANVPLPNKSVDVSIFCLSLMGTNLADFIREAHRVLKDDGVVKIAEVRSRLEYSHAPDAHKYPEQKEKDSKSKYKKDKKDKSAGTLDEFVQMLDELGFECTKTDRSNKMFVLLELKKNKKRPNKKLAFTARPCIYKRR